MIDLDLIQEEIDVLENGQTTYANLQKLSWLYIVKAFSKGVTTSNIVPMSDFLEACRGKDPEELFDVLDEHMEAIQLLCPKEYEAVLRKIQSL